MVQWILDETQRRILEFLGRHYPYETYPNVYEQRIVICGELRLALHEYDAACSGLYSQGLISTDPPYAADCDSIALNPAGRRAAAHPVKEGGLVRRLLAALSEATPAAVEPGWVAMARLLPALGLLQDAAGLKAYQKACQELYTWALIERQREGANWYASIALTDAGRQALS